MNQELLALQKKAGIHFPAGTAEFQQKGIAFDFEVAMDAQPGLVTTSNAGIPAYLTNYIDPALIEVLVSPMKAVEVTGQETKKGDWTSVTAMFPVVESTGQTSAYGDYSTSGQAGANVNWPQREAFQYQVITQWGELELERMGLARIDWANRQNIASVLVLNKFQNNSYFYGVANLQNYGLLNDPGLYAPILPAIKAAGGTSWNNATALEVYADIQSLYRQLQTQSNGLVDLSTAMTLAMSPTAEVGLTKTTEFNVNVSDLLKKNYPNMKIVTAPQYATLGGQLVQLIADELDGQKTAFCAFTEKLRAHPIKIELSSFQQKKSQGTWGTVIIRTFAISQMLGV
ncbi:MAG: Aeromonas phage 4 [Pseudomonadota bacterium]|jgi:hypothetical protein